jgi:hypothetical protein
MFFDVTIVAPRDRSGKVDFDASAQDATNRKERSYLAFATERGYTLTTLVSSPCGVLAPPFADLCNWIAKRTCMEKRDYRAAISALVTTGTAAALLNAEE